MQSHLFLKGYLKPILYKVLLESKKTYGYEFIKVIKVLTKGNIEITEGALYPLLHSLERKKLIDVEIIKQGRRARKYYKLTEAGVIDAKECISEVATFNSMISNFIFSNKIEDFEMEVNEDLKFTQGKETHLIQNIDSLERLEVHSYDRKFALHSGEKVKMISGSNIIYIEGDGRYCHLYINTNEVFTTPKNLKNFEEYFTEKSTFIRISKTFMINAVYIKEYSKGEPFVIKMTNNQTFEVARRKKAEVLERLNYVKV